MRELIIFLPMFKASLTTPYYAVAFSSVRTREDKGYSEMDDLVYAEVEKMPGYLGHEGTRQQDGFGIHISYWKDLESIQNWKENSLHKQAKRMGEEQWYDSFKTRICKVEKEY
ncbi:MAG: antibiotic biosynthesis monooxygenase [Flavobacteriales bacterium]|jgi:heme-degrading monooxygenase HmoA